MLEIIKQINVETGTHALGNNTTLNAVKGISTIEFHEYGVIYNHLSARKRLLIPFSNIKAIVLEFESKTKEVEKVANKK